MAGLDNGVKWTAAGLDAVHVAYRGSSGYMAGFANLTASGTNTGSGMRRLVGAQTAPFSIQDVVIKQILGDDAVLDSYQFASTAVQQGVLEIGATDTAFELAADGTAKETVGVYDFIGRGGTIANPGTFMFLLTRQAHGQDSGNAGQAGFENELVMYTRVKALGDNNKAHQAEGKMRYNVTFNDSTVTPWGPTTTTAFSATKRMSVVWTSTQRSMLHCWIGDGTAVLTTALDYTPVSAATTKSFNFTTVAADTVSSVNTSTKIVTLSAAGASGDIHVLVYQTPSF